MATTFLLVEDDPGDVALLKQALKDAAADIHIQTVNNGVDAALYLKGEAKFADRAKFPVPDVILLDIRMPLFDGFEFLEWLRNQAPAPQWRIPVVVLSSSDREEDIERVKSLGANAHVVKSSRWSEYKERVCSTVKKWALPNPAPGPKANHRIRGKK
jgi:CheY-like chemotaxis protein